MRCLKCAKISFKMICKDCQNILSEYEQGCRLVDGFKVYYFYKYSDIKELLATKHHLHGSFVISHLASLSLAKFASEFSFGSKVAVVALDDNIKSGYSHTAILAKALSNSELSPIYRALRAINEVKYAGKSLEFRRKNPRKFQLLKQIKYPVILVDDIITTGSSMLEAKKVLAKAGINVLFGLVLADARE
ncbi:ComF family protein [Campylobacter porcelli]|uniref:ComF family protein n=1 Tax=Campylobacter porcelli TaxID=1660073 RepID=A0A1X9SV44_9BACT|nr:ComF family protein [Campylobacter sp. RM6137]ARR00101.1 transformation system, predicted amidophosphoribosyltransferase CtsW [Campylobacter sp. RM6137]MEE3744045.1 ComF family protein [Campylobacter sp. CX2-4855-23]